MNIIKIRDSPFSLFTTCYVFQRLGVFTLYSYVDVIDLQVIKTVGCSTGENLNMDSSFWKMVHADAYAS